MAEEQWIKEAKEKIDREVDLTIWGLKRLAEKENLEVEWVLESFSSKFQYKISKRD